MAVNSGGHAFKRFRRYLQGSGVEYRRSMNLTGAGVSTPIPVAGLKSQDELLGVQHLIASPITSIDELLTETATPAVQAFITPAQAGGNNDIKWLAQPAFEGSKGNNLSIEYLNGGASKALSVDVINGAGGQETKVSVVLATDAGSVITSTANQVIDAVAAHPQAASMMFGEATEGTGDGLSVAVAATSLSGGVDAYPANVIKVVTAAVQASITPVQAGGNNDILWVAMSSYPGTKGNALSIEYLTGGNNKVLGVDVINGAGGQETKVSVQLATDGAGVGTTTANQVIDAVAGHPQAAGMMDGRASEGTGDGLSVAVAATSLATGADESVAVQTPTNTTGNKVVVEWLTRP